MVKFDFRRSVFKIREMAFGSLKDALEKQCDVVYLHSNEAKCSCSSPKGTIVHKQYTLINDLQLSEEELYKKIGKTCRYEIRRAEKEGCDAIIMTSHNLKCSLSVIDHFRDTYNDMFGSKGLSHYVFNESLILSGIDADCVVISFCSMPNDERLKVYHAYLCDSSNAVLIYSASPLWGEDEKDKTNCIGRMNKFLHWEDIKWFKAQGFDRYEWGGINSLDSPNGIARFKMEFGGEADCFNNYIVPRSLLGLIYVSLIKYRER